MIKHEFGGGHIMLCGGDAEAKTLHDKMFSGLYVAERGSDNIVRLFCEMPNNHPRFEVPIKESQDLVNHSESFEYGYAGSGPAQLGLAILFRITKSKDLALRHYQDFKSEILAETPRHVKQMCFVGLDVVNWIADKERNK